MVLAQMVADDQFQDHILDLLNDDCGIENALHLSDAAKNALEFLRRDKVHVKAIINAFAMPNSISLRIIMTQPTTIMCRAAAI